MYIAPEIAFQAEFYDAKCDIWSLGVVLYRMFYNSFPIWSTSPEEHIEKLRNFNMFFPPYDVSGSHKIKFLLQKMLVIDPNTRISWKELFELRTFLRDSSRVLTGLRFTKKGKLDRRVLENKQLNEELVSLLEEEYKSRNMIVAGNEYTNNTFTKGEEAQDKFRQITISQAFQNTQNNTESGQDEMEIQREKSQEDTSNEILEMIKILWNERENQKQKDQVIELELRKNHQDSNTYKNN